MPSEEPPKEQPSQEEAPEGTTTSAYDNKAESSQPQPPPSATAEQDESDSDKSSTAPQIDEEDRIDRTETTKVIQRRLKTRMKPAAPQEMKAPLPPQEESHQALQEPGESTTYKGRIILKGDKEQLDVANQEGGSATAKQLIDAEL